MGLGERQWAAVFPGQGSQAVGMGREIFEEGGAGRQRLEAADRATGGRLLPAMLEGPAEALNQTELTQPALYAVSAALWDQFTAQGASSPICVAGHSLGEYSALYAAGVFDYEVGLGLVVKRGQLMQAASRAASGAMAAVIGLEDQAVEQVVESVGQGLVVANYNSPGQVVISGPKPAVDAALEPLKAAGAKRVLPLPVSGAFHSPAVAEANGALAEIIRQSDFRDPQFPVIMNVDAACVADANGVRERLLIQMVSSVLWTRTVRTIEESGASCAVEIGHGKVLAGLVKRTRPGIEAFSVGSPPEVRALLA